MPDLLSSGIDLMLLGMSTVFVFLTLLVFSTRLMSFILNTLVVPETESAQSSMASIQNDDQDVVAIAAAAMAVHQASK